MIPVSARNIEFVGHSDQNGRGDGVQVMVHRGHAFVGHMFSDGFTVTDVRDPKHPRPVNFIERRTSGRSISARTTRTMAAIRDSCGSSCTAIASRA